MALRIPRLAPLAAMFACLTALPLAAADSPASIPTLAVKRQESGARYVADGVVEAIRQSVLSAQTAGRIVERPVEAGAAVKRGTLLLRIDDREAAQAESARKAELAAAEAQLANAQSELDRTKQLFAKALVGQAALDRAETAQRAALAQVRALSASSDVSTTQRSFTRVLAPYDGLVAAVQVQVGDMATPGKPLLTVYDPSAMRVVASLPVAQLGAWQRDQAVTILLPNSEVNPIAAGVTVLPVADPNAQQVQIRIDLPPGVSQLMPGMFAKVAFPIGNRPRLLVPDSAVVRRGELTAVYVTRADGQFSLRQIRLAGRDGNQVEVVAGLQDGEVIALDPMAAARNRSQP